MTTVAKLTWIRWIHTAIFVVMAAAVLYILACGVVGRTDSIFLGSVVLITVEGVVFFGNGRRCPFTNLAKSYGASKGYVFDTWFPERLTRYTSPLFGSLLGVGLLLWLVHRLF